MAITVICSGITLLLSVVICYHMFSSNAGVTNFLGIVIPDKQFYI